VADRISTLPAPAAAAPVEGLTAAARILAPTREDAPRPESWHDEAWGFRNTTGELVYAEMWLANSLSGARLMAARRPPTPGAEPEPIEDGPAADAVARFAGGVGGQAALLRSFAAQLLTPGVGYLLGEMRVGGGEDWAVYSADQIRLSRSSGGDQEVYEIIEGPDSYRDVRVLPPGSLPVKVYRPHPRFSWEPDSPVRGALPILRELSLLTQHVEATATSRLAGAGVLFMDSAIQFEDAGGWDKWLDDFLSSIVRPIRDRGSAAAYAPFPVRIPVPKGVKLPDLIHHLMFNTPFDEHALQLRDEAIGRLATAMDMPRQALTGEQENHWGKWATTEEGITLHVKPNLELICDGLTKGYMRPSLRSMQSGLTNRERRGARRLSVVRNEPALDADGSEIILWYDTTDLEARPDRSDDARYAYDNFEATGDDFRREAGISEAEQADPADEATRRRIWFRLVTHPNPDIAQEALKQLGMITESVVVQPAPALPPAPEEAAEGPGDDDEDLADDEGQGPPGTEDDPAPSQTGEDREPPNRAAEALGVVAACDVLVMRALERAGNKFRSRLRGRLNAPDLNGAGSCAPTLIHTHVDIGRVYARPVDELLEKAWEWVPHTAAVTGQDPAWLAERLHSYVLALFRERRAHSPYRLACWLGYGDQVEPQRQDLEAVSA
jgi:hypothetical protein